MKFSFILMSIILCVLWNYIGCMIVVPERSNVSQLNPKYASQCVFNVRRYGRKSPYVLNLFGTNLQEWNNNVTVDIIFSQFLHNEYRRSFVEMHYKMCDLINDEPFIGGMLKLGGIKCPLIAGYHAFMNMSAPTNKFNFKFPFEKGRIDGTLSVTGTKEIILHMYLEASFKQ